MSSQDDLTDGVLAVNVNEVNPATGDTVSLEAGARAPVWLARAATNPAIWQGGAAPDVSWAPPAGRGAGPPPHGGAGSGREPWTEYARSMGITVTEDMNRDQIIAACSAAGIPVE